MLDQAHEVAEEVLLVDMLAHQFRDWSRRITRPILGFESRQHRRLDEVRDKAQA